MVNDKLNLSVEPDRVTILSQLVSLPSFNSAVFVGVFFLPFFSTILDKPLTWTNSLSLLDGNGAKALGVCGSPVGFSFVTGKNKIKSIIFVF